MMAKTDGRNREEAEMPHHRSRCGKVLLQRGCRHRSPKARKSGSHCGHLNIAWIVVKTRSEDEGGLGGLVGVAFKQEDVTTCLDTHCKISLSA